MKEYTFNFDQGYVPDVFNKKNFENDEAISAYLYQNYGKDSGINIPPELITTLKKHIDERNGPGIEGIYQILAPMVQLGNQYGLSTDQLVKGLDKFSGGQAPYTNGSSLGGVGVESVNTANQIAGKGAIDKAPLAEFLAKDQQAMNNRIAWSRQGDNFWSGTFTDPQFLMAAGGLLGIGLSGAAAAGGAALGGEAAAPAVGAAEVGSASLDPLLSSGFLADSSLSASELASVLSSEGWSASEIASLTGSGALEAGGGMWDWFDPNTWSDTSWLDNLGSVTDSSGSGIDWSNILNTGNQSTGIGVPDTSGWWGGAGNVSDVGIGVPDTAGWWGAAGDISTPLGVGGSSIFDSLKGLYDEYGKPIKTAYDAIDKALSPSGQTGGLARLLSSGLGAYGSYSQANAQQNAADKYFNIGEPYRQRLAGLYNNPEGFLTSKEVQVPVQQGTNALARSLSMQGNPVASGNALQQLQSYSSDQLFGKLGQEKDRLAGFGGLTSYNKAAPQAESNAIGAKSNIFNAVGAGISNIFNPPQQQNLADILKQAGY